MNTKMQRQGDLLITKTNKIPSGKVITDGVLLRGESTGHKHQLKGGKVVQTKSGDLYFEVVKKAQLLHEEHNTLEFGSGKYAVIRQREYAGKDMVKIVVD